MVDGLIMTQGVSQDCMCDLGETNANNSSLKQMLDYECEIIRSVLAHKYSQSHYKEAVTNGDLNIS